MLQQGTSLETVQSTSVTPLDDAATDPSAAVDAARALARKCDYEAEHTDQVTRLALELFDELRPTHGLDDRDRLVLECAGQVHDIGWQAGAKGHHKTAMRLILSAEDLRLSSADRIMVALVARYHRKALPRNGHPHFGELAKPDKRRVRMLAGILRVADGLDRSHGSVVKDICCELTDQRLTVRCRTDGPALAELGAARKKGNLLENALHRVLTIEVQAE